MNASDPHTEVLPGFTRVDLNYLAECLEGVHGAGRVAEAAPQAAEFLRAALARATTLTGPLPRRVGRDTNQLGAVTPAGNPLLPLEHGVIDGMKVVREPSGRGDRVAMASLTPEEEREILQQRERAERNRGDEG